MTGGGGRRGGCRRREAAGDRALNATRQSQTRRSGRRCPSGKQGNLFHSLWTVRWSFPHVWTRFIHTCGKLHFSGAAKGSRQASLRRTASPRWIVCLDGPPSLGEGERVFVGVVRRSGVESAMAALASAFAKRLLKGLLRSRICVGGAGENRFRRPSGGPKRPVWCGKEGDKSAGRPACVHSFSTGKEGRSTGRMTRVSLITQTQALVV